MLEEDNIVAPDFMHILREMSKMAKEWVFGVYLTLIYHRFFCKASEAMCAESSLQDLDLGKVLSPRLAFDLQF